ncbi:hypothetical protein [Candidatus Nitronereus thalassa]|uniref:Lipoprotein n=1 Tax=Candidatus Nitronereus thalassa TaxID=3020898 RepID=A0ABU3K6H4_9BACT|nr:hypothetical protein [Candidatus Nitronereus thalassa]MDT7042034.1 hypothetical protein [Candidatus Nitronereus thalassa]
MVRVTSVWKVLCVLMIGALSVSGCLGNREWTYPPLPDKTYLDVPPQDPISARLVVLPLEDLRGNKVQDEYWKVAIPLVPHGVASYDRPETVVDPEEVDELFFDPSKDFARALADEIREAKIFSSVTFAGGESPPSSDYVLRGRLHSTKWERRLTTYLLGPLGTVFWMIGLPMGETTTEVEMDLRLTPTGDPSQVLWSFAMKFQGAVNDGVYYGLEESVQSYPVALQDSFRPAIIDLAEKSKTRIPGK